MTTRSFQRVGFHLDLRAQAMPIKALHQLMREIASLGYNTLLIEWEGTYPYKKHPLISNKYSYTREEVKDFIRECTRLGIDVIPLQQCLGHIEYILQHPRYAHLREDPRQRDLSQLCPCKAKEAVAVFSEIFADVAAMHPSPYVHIGGDETHLLGHCPTCSAKVKKYGKSKLYVDYFTHIIALLKKHGKRPILWADMLLKNPEAVSTFPKGTIFMDWNYGWPPNLFGEHANIKSYEMWGAPALRCAPDNHSLSTWKTHFYNLRSYVPFAKKSGFGGLVLTSWSTSGEYGYEWELYGDVLEMLPIRRLYPLSGFRMLLVAYIEAVKSAKPLNAKFFVEQYARERFGLTARHAALFYKSFCLNQALLLPYLPQKEREVAFKDAGKSQRLLRSLTPTRNKKEFQHFQLMADFREMNTRLRRIEAAANAKNFTTRQVPGILKKLAMLIRESKKLDRRFLQLNKDYLYPQQLEEEVAYRNKKLLVLQQRLSRSGRS
ncbi:MAG: beta-N-acetylhexosaminidase [Chthoniobacterales bacterium]